MSDFAEGLAVGQNNCNNGMYGMEWVWIIVLFALCGGWGNNWGGNGGNQQMGYELGKVATTNDVASGFSNSAVLSSLNDIKLGQSNLQNNINQGFFGINDSIKDCCCQTQRAIDNVNFNMERNTCSIIKAMDSGFQRLMDYNVQQEMARLRDERDVYRNQLSQNTQTNTIINTLRPVAQPAYLTCSPFETRYAQNNTCCGNNQYY